MGIAYGRSRLTGQLSDPLPRSPGRPSRIRASVISVALVLLPAAIVGARGPGGDRWRSGDIVIGAVIGLVVVVFWAYETDPVRSDAGLPREPRLAVPVSPIPNYLTGGRPPPLSRRDLGGWLRWLEPVATVVVPAPIAAGQIGVALRRGPMRLADIPCAALGSPAGILPAVQRRDRNRPPLVGASLVDLRPISVASDPTIGDPADDGSLAFGVGSGHSMPLAAPSGPGRSPVSRRGVVVAPLVVLAGMSLVYLLNSHAFDVARWRAGDDPRCRTEPHPSQWTRGMNGWGPTPPDSPTSPSGQLAARD